MKPVIEITLLESFVVSINILVHIFIGLIIHIYTNLQYRTRYINNYLNETEYIKIGICTKILDSVWC